MKKSSSIFPRLMIAAGGSGSGKTTVTCGLLQAFLNRGIKTVAFKCGPDYIDPMFHTEVMGLQSRNLDMFFTGKEVTAELFCRNAEGSELAVIEGVMGYYDGLAAKSTEASSYALACELDVPVVLVVDCKGKSVSIAAEIKGFLQFRENSNIKGVILNRLSPMLYPDMRELIEDELGITVYGYLPVMKDCCLESRHLGLITAKEIGDLKDILHRLAEQAEASVDLPGLLSLAESSDPGKAIIQRAEKRSQQTGRAAESSRTIKAAVAVAMDKAFCFYYQDNLDLLKELGAELVPFSPLEDERLPEGISGLILGGGYPELYLSELSQNASMLSDMKQKLEDNLPCLAECGGFMYLHEWIESEDGTPYSMVGAVEGKSYPVHRLGRFGYISLQAEKDSVLGPAGTELRGHEFHYWDSTNTGDAFLAQKPLRERSWQCMIARGNLLAGYPHIHYYSNTEAARNFVKACACYGERAGKRFTKKE